MLGIPKPAAAGAAVPTASIDAEYRRHRRSVFAGIFLGLRRLLPRSQQPRARDSRHPARIPASTPRPQLGLALTGTLDRLRPLEVPDGLGLRPQQPEVLPAARPAAVVRDHGDHRACARASTRRSRSSSRCRRSTAGCRAWAGRRAARRWCTGSARSERGLVVSVWNVAHNVGGALVANFALLGVMLFNDWGAKFYFNALIAAVVAVGRVLPDARHAAVVRPAADRGVQERLSARTTAPITSARSRSARSSSSTC